MLVAGVTVNTAGAAELFGDVFFSSVCICMITAYFNSRTVLPHKFYRLSRRCCVRMAAQSAEAEVDARFTRSSNTDHTGAVVAVGEAFDYGTSGFRCLGSKLPFAVFRMGALAALRSRSLGGRAVGLMITASHNPAADNGVKLIDPRGEMLHADWEPRATRLVNAKDELFATELQQLESELKLASVPRARARVLCAHDTRASSVHLLDAALAGVRHVGATAESHGLLTTPQLHHIVSATNEESPQYGPTEAEYYDKVCSAFDESAAVAEGQPRRVFVDCANGVGAPKLQAVSERLANSAKLQIVVLNHSGELNLDCGADHVKIKQDFPKGVEVKRGERWASLDGDADRLIYFYRDQDDKFHMLDGDKIAVLFAIFIRDCLDGLKKEVGWNFDGSFEVVQTAYANGASTAYIKETLGLPVRCVPTGIKHLQLAAAELHVGVYFEANGHGTVCFGDGFKRRFATFVQSAPSNIHCRRLRQFVQQINETVGDAIADLLAIEYILEQKGWTIEQWDAVYKDLPNCQLKVRVPDRRVVKTNYDETRVLEPSQLQSQIDNLLPTVARSRAFVRPSGTEDIVRVYAEAETQESANELAAKIEAFVMAICV